jgi:hypothetical protein
MKPAFRVGDYVKVDEDTSANMNRPEGFGFVQAVKGVGAATLAPVKYNTCFDSGHTHHDVPFESITASTSRMVAVLSSLDSFVRNHSKWHKRW